MRTTLEIDDDVLSVARDVARLKGTSLGKVVSEFARQALTAGAAVTAVGFESEDELHRKLEALGLVPFSARGGQVVTDDMVNTLREQEGV